MTSSDPNWKPSSLTELTAELARREAQHGPLTYAHVEADGHVLHSQTPNPDGTWTWCARGFMSGTCPTLDAAREASFRALGLTCAEPWGAR